MQITMMLIIDPSVHVRGKQIAGVVIGSKMLLYSGYKIQLIPHINIPFLFHDFQVGVYKICFLATIIRINA